MRLGFRAVALVATVLAALLLVGSLFVWESRWDTRFDGIGGEDSLLDAQSARLYTSSDVLAHHRVGPGRADMLGGLYFRDREWFGDGGSMALAGGWLFFGRNDFRLFSFDTDGLPVDGRIHNFTGVEHRGPVNVIPLFDWAYGGNRRLGELAVSDATLFLAASEDGLGRKGHILALDVSNPATMTTEASSLRVLYNLTFDGIVSDLAVQGTTLYALEWAESRGTIHGFDLSAVPPPERLSLNLSGTSWRFDVEGDLLVSMGNRTVDVFRLRGDSATQLSSVAIPGDGSRIVLSGSRVYIIWHTTWNERNVDVFDLSRPEGPRLLWRIELTDPFGHSGSDPAVMGDDIFIPGSHDVAIHHLATYPALITNGFLQAAFAGFSATAMVSYAVHRRGERSSSDEQPANPSPPRP